MLLFIYASQDSSQTDFAYLCKRDKSADTILTPEILSKAISKWKLLLLISCKTEMDCRRNKNLKIIVVMLSVHWSATQRRGWKRFIKVWKLKLLPEIFSETVYDTRFRTKLSWIVAHEWQCFTPGPPQLLVQPSYCSYITHLLD